MAQEFHTCPDSDAPMRPRDAGVDRFLAEAAADGAPTDVSDASSALPHGWLRGIDTSSEPSQTYYWDR